MSQHETPMMTCPECKGAGGTFEDRWGTGGHYTADSACGNCEGSGEVEALCQWCLAPGGIPCDKMGPTDTGYSCAVCKAELEAMNGQANVEASRAEVHALLPELFS